MFDSYGTLGKVAIYGGIAAGLVGVSNLLRGKPLVSNPLGDAQVYEGGYTVRSSDFNRRGPVRGNWSLKGLSGHQARFGAVASSCGGRGYNPKQFRGCMSRGLR